MRKCKNCGKEECGYGSLLDKDGYCFDCGCRRKNNTYNQTFMDCLDDAIKTLKAIDEGCSGTYVCMCNCQLADDFLRRWQIKKS